MQNIVRVKVGDSQAKLMEESLRFGEEEGFGQRFEKSA